MGSGSGCAILGLLGFRRGATRRALARISPVKYRMHGAKHFQRYSKVLQTQKKPSPQRSKTTYRGVYKTYQRTDKTHQERVKTESKH